MTLAPSGAVALSADVTALTDVYRPVTTGLEQPGQFQRVLATLDRQVFASPISRYDAAFTGPYYLRR